MTPGLALNDVAYIFWSYAITTCYRRTFLSVGNAVSDLKYYSICKLREMVHLSELSEIFNALSRGLRITFVAYPLPFFHSPLYSGIPDIIEISSEKEMVWVAARRVVAAVANEQPKRICPIGAAKGDPCGDVIVAAYPKTSVVMNEPGRPWPTLILTADIHFGPKPIVIGVREFWQYLKLVFSYHDRSQDRASQGRRSVDPLLRPALILAGMMA